MKEVMKNLVKCSTGYWEKPINGIDLEKMANIWIIAGHCIAEMYNQRLKVREGVG